MPRFAVPEDIEERILDAEVETGIGKYVAEPVDYAPRQFLAANGYDFYAFEHAKANYCSLPDF